LSGICRANLGRRQSRPASGPHVIRAATGPGEHPIGQSRDFDAIGVSGAQGFWPGQPTFHFDLALLEPWWAEARVWLPARCCGRVTLGRAHRRSAASGQGWPAGRLENARCHAVITRISRVRASLRAEPHIPLGGTNEDSHQDGNRYSPGPLAALPRSPRRPQPLPEWESAMAHDAYVKELEVSEQGLAFKCLRR
jgi:hypothetical protein